MVDEPEDDSDTQPADLEAAQAQLLPQLVAGHAGPDPSPGQHIVTLARKGATLVPHTIQLSFCLEPGWRIPMMRGPNGEYMHEPVGRVG